MRQIGIGLAGLGTVGAGVYKHVARNRALLCERLGLELVIRRAVVRDLAKPRAVDLPPDRLTTRWQDLIDDPGVDIVVELMGGIDEPLALIRAAIAAGKIVVTGNKALLAEHGQEIFALAAEKKVPVFFEASTAGGIPIIKTIREALIANHIVSIHGIINGTSNYILTRMTDAGLDFAEALAEAQAQGYAEADPTLDINGWDAAHKAVILASLAYGFWVGTDKIFVEGIDKLTATDIRFADELGLPGQAARHHQGRRQPRRGGRRHRGARASDADPEDARPRVGVGVFNAVAVRGDVVGETLFYGRGAGQDPTAARSSATWRKRPSRSAGSTAPTGSRRTDCTGRAARWRKSCRGITCGSRWTTSRACWRRWRASSGGTASGSRRWCSPRRTTRPDRAQLVFMLDHASDGPCRTRWANPAAGVRDAPGGAAARGILLSRNQPFFAKPASKRMATEVFQGKRSSESGRFGVGLYPVTELMSASPRC